MRVSAAQRHAVSLCSRTHLFLGHGPTRTRTSIPRAPPRSFIFRGTQGLAPHDSSLPFQDTQPDKAGSSGFLPGSLPRRARSLSEPNKQTPRQKNGGSQCTHYRLLPRYRPSPGGTIRHQGMGMAHILLTSAHSPRYLAACGLHRACLRGDMKQRVFATCRAPKKVCCARCV